MSNTFPIRYKVINNINNKVVLDKIKVVSIDEINEEIHYPGISVEEIFDHFAFTDLDNTLVITGINEKEFKEWYEKEIGV